MLDRLSSIFSLFAFVVACFFARFERTRDSEIQIWRENVLIVNGSSSNGAPVLDAFKSLEDTLQGFCPSENTEKPLVKLYYESRNWDNTTYDGSAFVEPAGQFNPWGLLIWIFLVSVTFQSIRGWKQLQEWTGVMYNPRKPDFWRWLEYALTAPFQIILIGTSVFINERGQVMNMAGLQAALVLMGYMNEKRIDSFYKRVIKAKSDMEAPSRSKWAKLWLQTVFCWAFFIIIWYTIIARFDLQKKNLSDCLFDVEMPREVSFIVWSQAALFFLFGLTQLVQIYTLCFTDKAYIDGTRVLQGTKPETADRWWQDPEDFESIGNLRAYRWHVMSFRYSLLSVVGRPLKILLARSRMIFSAECLSPGSCRRFNRNIQPNTLNP